MKRCTILLVNWNGWADTIECLESLFRLEYPDFRVIVCDNGSKDGSLEKLKAWADGSLDVSTRSNNPLRNLSWPPTAKPVSWVAYDRAGAESGGEAGENAPLVLIDTGENLGFAGGNNVGLRYVMQRDDSDSVWLLNNDTVVDPLALTELVARLAAKADVGICGSTLLRYSEPGRIQARGGGWYCKWIGLPWHIGQLGQIDDSPNVERVERWMNYVVGASMLVPLSFVKEVGLLCEDYFLYFEETDWALRSKDKFTLAYAAKSHVFHKVGASIGTTSNPLTKSFVCDFYSVRNRLLFTWRYFPWAMPGIYLGLIGALLTRMLSGQWGRVRMIWSICLNFRTVKLSAVEK